MIKNIIFDLGNVLLKSSPSIVLENLNISDEIKNNIKSKFFNNWQHIDLGEESIKEHFDNCKFNFDIDKSTREILLNYYKYRPFNNEMIELMNKLKHNNYKIFILSNNNKETCEYLKQLPIFERIDGWIVSCDYHIVKPNKEIYVKLFNTFNIKPDECFFIDDNKKNVEIGAILGMQGFTFKYSNNNIDELINNMKQNNIVL